MLTLNLFTAKDITALRQSLGLTLREFGELLDVSEATASRWEADKYSPPLYMQKRLNKLAEKSLKASAAAP